jgi:hypothetical protein
MVAKNAGVHAMDMELATALESVLGVVWRVGAVEKVGLEMDVMVPLGELLLIIVYYQMDIPKVKNEK